jgi:hypothetical protein
VTEERKFTIREFHAALGPALFNKVWEIIDNPERTKEDVDEMVHAAHASWYHWSKVGTVVNLARGEWLISRVYTVVNRSECALHHGERCLEICVENGIGDFDIAFAYEAVARAHFVSGRLDLARESVLKALEAAEVVADPEDRALVLADINSILPPEETEQTE